MRMRPFENADGFYSARESQKTGPEPGSSGYKPRVETLGFGFGRRKASLRPKGRRHNGNEGHPRPGISPGIACRGISTKQRRARRAVT